MPENEFWKEKYGDGDWTRRFEEEFKRRDAGEGIGRKV
jgi:hypothetical protein